MIAAEVWKRDSGHLWYRQPRHPEIYSDFL